MSEIRIPAIAEDGTLYPVGKLEAHINALYHVAVSIFVFDGNKLLLQRRALDKYHSGGLWANTCCTHPNWMEDVGDCAGRRLKEELGFTTLLDKVGNIEYSAPVGPDLHEHEYVHLFIGKGSQNKSELDPNPVEVMETAWLTYDEITERVNRKPETFTPWMKIYLQELGTLFPGNNDQR